MPLQLAETCEFGFMGTMGSVAQAREMSSLADECGYNTICVGDHVAFAVPIVDALTQLSVLAGINERIRLLSGVFLLPLRHPVPVAKQVSSLDLLCDGRLIFGVGVGGEFPNEYAACGVPVTERGARLTESLEICRALWSGEEVSYAGRHFAFDKVRMLPRPRTPGGPRVWCGGRSPGALKRTGRLANGWFSYVVTPEMYADALSTITEVHDASGRGGDTFDTGHLLFTRIDDDFETAWDKATKHLTERYAMDFRKPARKYCALGTPQQVAEKINAFREAGTRHFIIDHVGPFQERSDQLRRFAAEVIPLINAS